MKKSVIGIIILLIVTVLAGGAYLLFQQNGNGNNNINAPSIIPDTSGNDTIVRPDGDNGTTTDRQFLAQSEDDGAYYWIQNGIRYPVAGDKTIDLQRSVTGWATRTTELAKRDLDDFESGPVIATSTNDSDELLIAMQETPYVFRMRNGTRDYITPEEFRGRGFNRDNVVTVSPRLIKTLPPAEGMQHLSLQEAARRDTITITSTGQFFEEIASFTAGPFDQHTAINIERGDVFLSKDGKQSLIATQDFEVFAPRGKRATLEGVWGACIDKFRQWPEEEEVLDVTKNVRNWDVQSAAALADLVSIIDKRNVRKEQFAQDAIWRISDQESVSGQAQQLLRNAGITPSRHSSFPHLVNPSTATSTTYVVPPQLSLRGRIAGHVSGCGAPSAPDEYICQEELDTAMKHYLNQTPFPETVGQLVDSRTIRTAIAHYSRTVSVRQSTPDISLAQLRTLAFESVSRLRERGISPPSFQVAEVGTKPGRTIEQKRMQFFADGKGVREIKVTVRTLDGQTVYESPWTFGNSLRWETRTAGDAPVNNGIYTFTLQAAGWQGEQFTSDSKQFILKRQDPFGNTSNQQ